MNLPTPGARYDRQTELERNRVLEQADRENRKKMQDVDLSNGERLILKSPDGTRWSITVSDAGALTATAL